MSLKLNSSGGGSVTLQEPSTASNLTLTLPDATGTVLSSASTAGFPAGSVVQMVNFQFSTVATGTGTIPIDNTIPQNTEGTEFMSLAITPKSATNKLVITVCIQLDKNNGNTMITALFQDSIANALAAQVWGALSSGISLPMSFTHVMTAGTTSSTTFKVRAGSDNAGTVTVNGRGGGQIFGGVSLSSIVILEIAA
jgi:hypothetical protein